jgi:hypothetical protein
VPPALLGSYCASAVITGLFIPAPSNRITQSATTRSLFVFRLRNRNLLAASCSSETAGRRITTLAHSSNYRYWYRLCLPSRSETPDRGASLGFAAGFFDPRHLLFASRIDAARRLASWSLSQGGKTLPEEAGDICLRDPHSVGTDLSQGPGTPVHPDHFPRFSPGSIPEHVPVPLPRPLRALYSVKEPDI